MSTRANYMLHDNQIELGKVYIHYDGYPEGAASYFHKAMIQGSGELTLADFFRANPCAKDSTFIHDDIEFLYKIDVAKQTVSVFRINSGSHSPIFVELPIFEFINMHFTVFSGNPTYRRIKNKNSFRTEKEIEQRIKAEAYWGYISVEDYGMKKDKLLCIELLYKQLEELHKEFTEHVYFYGKDNPNTENILKAINSRYKAIQLLINTSDFPALTNNK